MTADSVLTIGQEAIKVLLMLSLPLLGVTLVVGLLISLFQAVTQIQEVTLTFVPKIIAVFVTLIFLSHWMIGTMVDFTRACFLNLPNLIR